LKTKQSELRAAIYEFKECPVNETESSSSKSEDEESSCSGTEIEKSNDVSSHESNKDLTSYETRHGHDLNSFKKLES